MGKRQRSRESSWGEFHAIHKVLDAATEAGGQGALGWEGRLFHSRCTITSRTKACQGQILGLRERNGTRVGSGMSLRSGPSHGYALLRGIRNEPETLLTNF